MEMVQLFDIPHGEARKMLSTGAPIYLTINPVEYHGPHLSLHNDRLISLGLARELHSRLARRHPEWPLLVGTDLEIGVEPCWGMGTRHTSYSQARALIVEACRAVAELGAQRVVLMTFHGAPFHNHAIDQGVQHLVARGVNAVAPFNLVLRQMVTLDPARFAPAYSHIDDAAERAAMMAGLRYDFHAGFFETSMALYYVPEAVSPVYKSLPPCPEIARQPAFAAAAQLARRLGASELAGELSYAATGFGWYGLKPFPGYTGRPHRATREAGAIFARYMLDVFEPVVEEVLAGRARSPAPIMAWARYLSLGGRLGAVKVKAAQMEGLDA
jgi:creatinine amidohydrolase